MTEAKTRNPNIETYGLAESWPRWVHGPNASTSVGPLDAPHLSAEYITEWVKGAKDVHNLTIDWVGMWNEHWEAPAVMYAYATQLRAQLDAAGLHATRIIGPDAFTNAAEALAQKIIQDPTGVGAAVDAIGVHGGPVADPSNPNGSATWRSGKKLYASEDGSTYGDVPGALQRVFDIHMEHIQSLSQGSNFWNPFSGYYPGLPFALHSLMDAHHPWSGHYRVRTPIWAAAHMNQHTAIGMDFLSSGSGVGLLASGCGSMLSYVSKPGTDVTIVIERDFLVSPQYQPPSARTNETCIEERATFTLSGKLASLRLLAVWLTVFEANGTIATLYER